MDVPGMLRVFCLQTYWTTIAILVVQLVLVLLPLAIQVGIVCRSFRKAEYMLARGSFGRVSFVFVCFDYMLPSTACASAGSFRLRLRLTVSLLGFV
jgi:hypothetical protein